VPPPQPLTPSAAYAALTNRLLGPSVKLSTVGGRAFSVAEPTI